jgi:hypothetical protein
VINSARAPDLLLSNLSEFATAHEPVPGTSANIPRWQTDFRHLMGQACDFGRMLTWIKARASTAMPIY